MGERGRGGGRTWGSYFAQKGRGGGARRMLTCDWLFRRTADLQEVVPCTDRLADASYATHRRRWSSHTGLGRQQSVTRVPGSFSSSNGININTTRQHWPMTQTLRDVVGSSLVSVGMQRPLELRTQNHTCTGERREEAQYNRCGGRCVQAQSWLCCVVNPGRSRHNFTPSVF